jgi:HEAT repeat protein
MEELKPEELEELVQELEGESSGEEPLQPEVEEILHVLQSGSPYLARQDAAEQLGRIRGSSPRIVQALNAAQESDPYMEVRRAAAKALRAPVHQEYLRSQYQEHPDLMAATEGILPQRPPARIDLDAGWDLAESFGGCETRAGFAVGVAASLLSLVSLLLRGVARLDEASRRQLRDTEGPRELLPEEAEDLMRILLSGRPYLARQDAAERLGRAGSSSTRIVQALIAAQESDPYMEVRRAAAKALRAPVHQEHLQQHPEPMETAETAHQQRSDPDMNGKPADLGPKQ